MAVSTIALVRETIRQGLMDDENFLKRILYFFELRVPTEVATVGGFFGFIFPLILPPTAYSMEEPFTVEATPTQGGGLYVEENGIVQRTIRLSGHTGFKPRPLKLRLGDAVPAILARDKKSYSRLLPETILDKISGQRHFHYLQDSVFRIYADLKRDPATAKDTIMLFHNPRDQEHWWVVPKVFTLERDAASPFLYRYNIELLVVDKAEETRADFSEDKGLLESFRDTLRSIKQAVDLVTGAFDDLTAMTNEIRLYVNDISTIMSSVNAAIRASTDFVNGVTDLIEAPHSLVENVIGSIEASMDHVNALIELTGAALVDPIIDFPEEVMNKFRTMADGLEIIGSYPAIFVDAAEVSISYIRDLQTDGRRFSNERLETALESDAPTSFDETRALGTQLTPGDAESAKGAITAGAAIRRYRSAREVSIEQGDTLMGLAARYLGDARAWQYIAVVNGLKPPFIDAQASAPLVASDGTAPPSTDLEPFPSTLGVGSKILIPSPLRSTHDMPNLPVQGAKPSEPAADQFLGTDLRLEAVSGIAGSSNAMYDVPIDTDLGSLDAKTISGVANLKQAVVTRLVTERGTDTLYKTLGVQRMIGLGFTPLDLETARFRVQEAVGGDARIAAVRKLVLEQEGDALAVDMTAEIRGFADSTPVRALI